MTYEEAMLYVRNAKRIIEMFGEEPFRRAVEKFDVADFSTKEIYEAPALYYRQKGYPIIRENFSWPFKEFKGEWMREVYKPAVELLVPSPYQLGEGKLILEILHAEYPFTAMFNLMCYHMDGENPECYLECGDEIERSLYVPYRAITELDFSIVEKRHREYFTRYYAGDGRKKYLENALSILDTWKAKLFSVSTIFSLSGSDM